MIRHRLLPICAGLALAGCASVADRWHEDAYYQGGYRYRVAYADPASRALLPPGWTLDNFVLDDAGTPLEEKSEEPYQSVITWDLDGDGVDDDHSTIFLYELRFVRRDDAGTVWLRSLPVSTTRGGLDLPALAREYLDAVTRGVYDNVKLGWAPSEGEVRPWTATVVAQGFATLSGRPAHDLTFDVQAWEPVAAADDSGAADLPAANGAPWRVRLVFAHAPYEWFPCRRFAGGDLAACDRVLPRQPVVLVAGYANRPEAFDAHTADFEDLVRRVQFYGEDGEPLPPEPGAVPVLEPANELQPMPLPPEPAVEPGTEPPAAEPAPPSGETVAPPPND